MLDSPESEIQKTRAFFDKPRKADPLRQLSPGQRFVFTEIASLIAEGTANQTAVDLGCHWGKYCLHLAKSYGRVIGLDFAKEALRTAAPHALVTYHACDLDAHPEQLADYAPIDFYLAVGLFEMLRNPGELLKQMRRFAGPQARLLIVIPNAASLNFRILRVLLCARKNLFRKGSEAIYHNKMSPSQLRSFIEAAGFKVQSQGFSVGMPIYLFDRLPNALQEMLLKWDGVALKCARGSYFWAQARI